MTFLEDIIISNKYIYHLLERASERSWSILLAPSKGCGLSQRHVLSREIWLNPLACVCRLGMLVQALHPPHPGPERRVNDQGNIKCEGIPLSLPVLSCQTPCPVRHPVLSDTLPCQTPCPVRHPVLSDTLSCQTPCPVRHPVLSALQLLLTACYQYSIKSGKLISLYLPP